MLLGIWGRKGGIRVESP